MAKLVGLSGSLRRASLNTGLLKAASELLSSEHSLSVHTIQEIPLYDADWEAEFGIPTAVSNLKEAIASSDGLIIATPEYNNSIPGTLKNAIDWLTRPAADIKRIFHGRPVCLIGATPGGLGTVLSQNEWLPILRYLGTKPWFGGRLMVSQAGSLFDAESRLTDAKTREQLKNFLEGFVKFVTS